MDTNYYLNKNVCEHCGRSNGTYDLVKAWFR